MAKPKPTLNTDTSAPTTVYPHVLTTEDRRRGAARTNEIRRERAMSEREKLEQVYEQNRDELMAVWVAEVKKGNMQALFGMHDRIFGTPAKAEPERTEIELVSGEARGTSLMDMLGELSQSPDNTGSNGDSAA